MHDCSSNVDVAGQAGLNGSSDIPRPYNAARQYPQIGQLRAPSHIWLPWDVLEDVVRLLITFTTAGISS